MALRNTASMYQRRGQRLASAPAVEPVTAAELRDLLRESTASLPDAEAEAFILEAREWIEEKLGIAMITQSWLLALDHWPGFSEPWWDGVKPGAIGHYLGSRSGDDVYLPRYPLQSVEAVTVFDEGGDGTAVVIANTFNVDTYREPGRITLKRGASWPVALRESNAIEIEYTSGFGDGALDVPAPMRSAVKRMAAWLYTNRGDCNEAADATSALKMLSPYRVARL